MKKLRLFDSLKLVLATVACIFMLNVAHAATLPAGYTELEYIESTGTQYIDTGYKPNAQNVKYVYSVQSTSTDTAERHPVRIAGGRIQIYRIVDHWSIYETSPTVSSSQIQNLGIMDKVDFVVENNYDNSLTILANNINVTRNYTPRSNTSTTDITLFTYTSSTTMFVGRIYYFKVYENGILRFNAVPVRRDSDGVVGMYDLADSNPETAFHTNAGTGNFIAGEYQIKIATTKYNEQQFAPVETDLDAAVAAVDTVVTRTMTQAQAIDQIATSKQTRPDEGCTAKYCLLIEDENGTPHWYPIAGANGVEYVLPAGYTQLEYIESTGTQYIDTNITGSTNAIIDMQGTPRTDDMVVFMLAPINATAYYNGFGQYQTTITGSFDIATRRVYNVSYTSNSMTVNGVNISNRYIANNVDLALFGSTATNNNRKIKDAKLYSAKIYNNDTLLRDLIQAKNSSGVVGMYDMASGQFFTNQGTGVFGEGPVVE